MAGRVVVVGNEKGGVGKTTLSVNIAAVAASKGVDVLLIDTDRQQSCAQWVARRREECPNAAGITATQMTGKAIGSDFVKMAARYELLVIDTAASDSVELRAAAVTAHVLVLPVGPLEGDLWNLPTMADLVKAARRHNPQLKVILAVNRVPHWLAERAGTEVRAWCTENLPDLRINDTAIMVNRTAFGAAFASGLGVTEVPRPDAKAASETETLYKKVMKK